MQRQHKDVEWAMPDKMSNGTWEQVGIIVLMGIRDQLQLLNSMLRCPNFQQIPAKLDAIKRNTAKHQVKKG